MMTSARPRLSLLILSAACVSVGCIQAIERTYTSPNDISLTAIKTPLPDNAFNANLQFAYSPPTKLKPAQRHNVNVIVSNLSPHAWPSAGTADGSYRINVGNHWLNETGDLLVVDDGRSPLPFDLIPKGRSEVMLTIAAPSKPGNYTLEIDVVQEGVSWFANKGSKTLRTKVTVEP